MVDRLSRYRLRDKEEEWVLLELKDVKFLKEECKGSLMGRIWCSKGTLKVIELDPISTSPSFPTMKRGTGHC